MNHRGLAGRHDIYACCLHPSHSATAFGSVFIVAGALRTNPWPTTALTQVVVPYLIVLPATTRHSSTL